MRTNSVKATTVKTVKADGTIKKAEVKAVPVIKGVNENNLKIAVQKWNTFKAKGRKEAIERIQMWSSIGQALNEAKENASNRSDYTAWREHYFSGLDRFQASECIALFKVSDDLTAWAAEHKPFMTSPKRLLTEFRASLKTEKDKKAEVKANNDKAKQEAAQGTRSENEVKNNMTAADVLTHYNLIHNQFVVRMNKGEYKGEQLALVRKLACAMIEAVDSFVDSAKKEVKAA